MLHTFYILKNLYIIINTRNSLFSFNKTSKSFNSEKILGFGNLLLLGLFSFCFGFCFSISIFLLNNVLNKTSVSISSIYFIDEKFEIELRLFIIYKQIYKDSYKIIKSIVKE